MSLLDATVANLAPGITETRDMPGTFNPRHSLAIYVLPIRRYSPSAPGVVLGEALAARSGLGCTLLDGIPKKIPEGAVIAGLYDDLHAHDPQLVADIPALDLPGQYAIRTDRHTTIVSRSVEGLSNGMQTLAMLVLRHNQERIPGALLIDAPLCRYRGVAMEIRNGELGINLLMQMLSFIATFKGNRIQLILDDSAESVREIPGLDTFRQSCRSYGIEAEIRMPWLGRLVSGELSPKQAWAKLHEIAEPFGATAVAFDDPCPTDAPAEAVHAAAMGMAVGDHGFTSLSADAELFLRAGIPAQALRKASVSGWVRAFPGIPLPVIDPEFPIRLDVPATLPGFSHRTAEEYHAALDAGLAWLDNRQEREMFVSFRNAGVSHLWQNVLYPAATGLIAGWGIPDEADQCAWIFANLLYGDSSAAIMAMWDKISAAFPGGLDPAGERVVRETAFGRWPDTAEAATVLSSIDWLEVANNIHAAAEAFKQTAENLSRNASTLTGAKLSLHALSWLHCFVVLVPELERRRREQDHADGRTETIAYELQSNYTAWYSHVETLSQESGLEVAELPQLEIMGQRIRDLCDAVAR